MLCNRNSKTRAFHGKNAVLLLQIILYCLSLLLFITGCRKKAPDLIFYPVEESEETTETTNQTLEQTETSKEKVTKKNVIIHKKVIEKVEVQEQTETIVNITTHEITTAKPPETIITTRANNNPSEPKKVENIINRKRNSSGVGALSTDSALSKEAQYYSDCFARDKVTYSIEGHKVKLCGKVNTINGLNNRSFNAGLSRSGFLESNLNKIGVGVSKSDNGGYYYVIIAE